MGGGDLNSKKSWHPNTMKNQERVWKAEQAAAEEKKRIMELQHERAAERDRAQLNDLAKRSAGATSQNDDRLHWMYDKPDKKAQSEDYLLGKSIEKGYDQPEKSDDVIPAVARRVVGSSMTVSTEDSQVDLVRKLREDPLLLVKERERAARAALLNNPLHRKRIAELLRKEQAQQLGMKNKKKKKKDKDLDSKLAAKLNALGGEKGIDVAALLASDDSSSSSESSEDEKPRKKKKKSKKSKVSRKDRKSKEFEDSDSEDNAHHKTERKNKRDPESNKHKKHKARSYSMSDSDNNVQKRKSKRQDVEEKSSADKKDKKRKKYHSEESKEHYDKSKKRQYRYERETKDGWDIQRLNEIERSDNVELNYRTKERDSKDHRQKKYYKDDDRRDRRRESRDSSREPVKRTGRGSSEERSRKDDTTSQRPRGSSGERMKSYKGLEQGREKQGRARGSGMSEEEKAARLAAMVAAGAEREEQRGRRVAQQRADTRREEGPRAPRSAPAAALPDSLEARIHSNRHYIQRNHSHMNEHFARR